MRRRGLLPDQSARPEGITNGYSCFSCHANGLINKKDEIRDVASQLEGISDFQREAILNLYPEAEVLTAALQLDNERYRAAIKEASLLPDAPSPSLQSLAKQYQKFITTATAATELGLTADEFLAMVNTEVSRSIQNQLLPLTKGDGQMPRELYEPVVEDLIRQGFDIGDFEQRRRRRR